MSRVLSLIAAGLITLVISLVGAALIAPLFGESVPLLDIAENAVSRARVGRRGVPPININIPERASTQILWASDLGLGNVEESADLEEGPGSIDSGLVVLRELRATIPQLEVVYEVLVASRPRIAVRNLRGKLGQFSGRAGTITIDMEVVEESNFVVAMVLAHEGQHALDNHQGRLGLDERSCYNAEARAFDLSIFIWQSLWGMQGKPNNVSKIEASFNRMASIRHEDPLGYVERLVDLYGDACA